MQRCRAWLCNQAIVWLWNREGIDVALTNAQKQARWRERRQAELQALREQAATLKAEPDLDPSGLDTRTIAVHDIAVWPGMPLPEAERLQELEQAMRAGRRFSVVVAEREDGSGYMLVGHLLCDLAFWCSSWPVAPEGLVCAGSGAAEPMDRLAIGSLPPLPAFAVPYKRGWLLIPAPRRLLEPGPDLLGAVRMLSVQRAALEHALHRLRHVQPAAAHRRVERHDAMGAQPQHQVGRLVAGQIVPHQQEPQRRQIVWQGEGHRQSRLPYRPRGPRHGGIPSGSRRRHLCEDLAQALAQPRVQDRIRAVGGWL